MRTLNKIVPASIAIFAAQQRNGGIVSIAHSPSPNKMAQAQTYYPILVKNFNQPQPNARELPARSVLDSDV